jgi:low temperature requirement protein LtrA
VTPDRKHHLITIVIAVVSAALTALLNQLQADPLGLEPTTTATIVIVARALLYLLGLVGQQQASKGS